MAVVGPPFWQSGYFTDDYWAEGFWLSEGGGPEQVATPTIDPNGGSHVTDVEVTLDTDTIGATIYYTTNGTLPDATDTEYTVPFTLSADTFLRVIAIADGLDDSDIAEATFNITAPGEVGNAYGFWMRRKIHGRS